MADLSNREEGPRFVAASEEFCVSGGNVKRVLGFVVAVGLVLGACSTERNDASEGSAQTEASAVPNNTEGGVDDTSATGSSVEQSANEEAAAESDSEADQAAAEAGLLVLSDFPVGWSEWPNEDVDVSSDLAAARAQQAECVGGDGEELLYVAGARAETGEFRSSNQEFVSQAVSITEEAMAVDFMADFGAEGVESCLAEANQQIFEVTYAEADSGVDFAVGEVTVGAPNLAPAGDDLIAYRVTIPFEVEGLAVDLFVDIAAVRVGGAISGLSFQSAFSPFPAEQATELVNLVVERLGGEPAAVDSGGGDQQTDRPTFGDTFDYADGLSVTIGQPTEFQPSDSAAFTPGAAAHLRFEVTIANNTGTDYDPNHFLTSLQSGSTEAEEVYDSAQGLGGSPSTTLLDGREVVFSIGYSVSVPDDLVMEVSPDFDRESVIFTS